MNTSLVNSVLNQLVENTAGKYVAWMNNKSTPSSNGFWCYSVKSESREDFEKRVFEKWGDDCNIQISTIC